MASNYFYTDQPEIAERYYKRLIQVNIYIFIVDLYFYT